MTTATLKASLQHDLDAYLKNRSAKEHLSSLSVTVSIRRGQRPINVTAGTTAFTGGPPVTPTSQYQIGSNTKAFTAVAILQLEAQGRLSIDSPIAKYLPQYPAYGTVTLRQLLSMTSGIDSYDNMPAWYVQYSKHPLAYVSPDRLIRFVYPHIKYTPGSRYSYSNTGYILAEEIIAARSKSKSFDAEIARIIQSVGLPQAPRVVAGGRGARRARTRAARGWDCGAGRDFESAARARARAAGGDAAGVGRS